MALEHRCYGQFRIDLKHMNSRWKGILNLIMNYKDFVFCGVLPQIGLEKRLRRQEDTGTVFL